MIVQKKKNNNKVTPRTLANMPAVKNQKTNFVLFKNNLYIKVKNIFKALNIFVCTYRKVIF